MKTILLISAFIFLVGCSTGPKISTNVDLVSEGLKPRLDHVQEDPFLMPEGQRTEASELSIRPVPAWQAEEQRLDYRLGLGFDGNGVPVLGVPLSVEQAMQLIADYFREQGVRVVREDLTSARLELASDAFRAKERSALVSIFTWQDARLFISFSEMGEHSRISLWRYNEVQPEPELRQDIFNQLSELLLNS